MSGPTDVSNATATLVTALRRMLRPLVQLLIEKQLLYPFVADLLKSTYVEMAEKNFPIEGKRQTVSRLSLLTGIHRREVKRIQSESSIGEDSPPVAMTLVTQIVARWTGERPWIDEEGRPRALPRTADDSESISFHRLVNYVSVDIHSRSVLDEWNRLGMTTFDEEGRVVLEASALIPGNGFSEKAHSVGRNIRDHIAAASHNLTSEGPPFLEQSIYYGALPPAAIAEISQLAVEVGQEALARVQLRARELEKEAGNVGSSTEADRRRITFGVYLFDAPSSSSPRSTDGVDALVAGKLDRERDEGQLS